MVVGVATKIFFYLVKVEFIGNFGQNEKKNLGRVIPHWWNNEGERGLQAYKRKSKSFGFNASQ